MNGVRWFTYELWQTSSVWLVVASNWRNGAERRTNAKAEGGEIPPPRRRGVGARPPLPLPPLAGRRRWHWSCRLSEVTAVVAAAAARFPEGREGQIRCGQQVNVYVGGISGKESQGIFIAGKMSISHVLVIKSYFTHN